MHKVYAAIDTRYRFHYLNKKRQFNVNRWLQYRSDLIGFDTYHSSIMSSHFMSYIDIFLYLFFVSFMFTIFYYFDNTYRFYRYQYEVLQFLYNCHSQVTISARSLFKFIIVLF